MSTRTRLLRTVAGLAAVSAILVIAFVFILPWLHTWGATSAEIAQVWPGDDLVAQPAVTWTHAATIQAPPEKVWPWLAQMGEGRGGFYSYTFIENIIAGRPVYHNANAIIPDLQNPQPGTTMIGGMLQLGDSQAGQWLLARHYPDGGFSWSWLWAIAPADNGQNTRLVIRMKVQGAPGETMPAPAVFFLDAGGFIMERKMIYGLSERAEGRIEQPYVQTIEIILWIATFLTGLAGAVLFLIQRRWQWPLAVGIAAVLALLALTYLQPALWIRGLMLLALLAALALARRARS